MCNITFGVPMSKVVNKNGHQPLSTHPISPSIGAMNASPTYKMFLIMPEI